MSTEIMEYDYKQRAYDGKWEILGKVQDKDNSYTYKTESGQRVTLVPEKWVTLRVVDLLGDWDE